jgi:predicted amidohydrolase
VTYGMFEESRDIAPGERFVPFESKHGRFGVLVCEDMWHISAGYIHFLNGVDAILVPSASPGRGVTETNGELRSARVWNTMLEAASLWFQTWIVYVNRVGVEDGITFGGGSRVIDPDGNTTAKLDIFDVGTVDARMTTAALERARFATPLRRDEKPWIVSRAVLMADTRVSTEELKQMKRGTPS